MKQIDTIPGQDEALQKEIISIAKKNRLKKRIATIFAVALIIVIAVTAAWFFGRKQEKEKSNEEISELKAEIEAQKEQIKQMNETPIVASAVAPRINLEIIHSEMNEIGELATTEYLYTDAAEFSDSKQIKNWNIPLTEKSFILKWSGVIKAGVDLNKVTMDVDESEKKVVVSIPCATILSYSVDNDSVEVLSEKDNIFNNITVNDKVKFDAKTEEAIK